MAFFIYTFSVNGQRSSPDLHRHSTIPMKWISTLAGSIRILFAGLWLVIRIILEYFGLISDGNDRTTGIKDLRDEYKKANYR